MGYLAVSKTEVDDGHVGNLLGNQPLSVASRGRGSNHVRSEGCEQALQGYANLPRILDDEDTYAR